MAASGRGQHEAGPRHWRTGPTPPLARLLVGARYGKPTRAAAAAVACVSLVVKLSCANTLISNVCSPSWGRRKSRP